MWLWRLAYWSVMVLAPLAAKDAHLLEISLHRLDQFFGAAAALGIARRIDDMKPNMVFDHLAHKTGERTACGDDEMQHIGAALFLFQRALDGFALTEHPPHSIQQLELLALGVRHG